MSLVCIIASDLSRDIWTPIVNVPLPGTNISETRVLIEYIPRAGYIEVNESRIYVCINVLCVMRQMYTVCILYIVNCRAGSEAT